MPTLSAGETDRGIRAAAMQRRAESQSVECRENPVSARDEIALVHKTNGSYRRRDRLTLSVVAIPQVGGLHHRYQRQAAL